MADPLVIDTDILIDVARGHISAASSLQALQQTYSIAISSITEMELIVGCRNKAELRGLDQLLSLFPDHKTNRPDFGPGRVPLATISIDSWFVDTGRTDRSNSAH